ncbi:MAG: cold-shock protein [Saccharothrix sp.]|nr:cold-shock protein [Saccharothrix sp.]
MTSPEQSSRSRVVAGSFAAARAAEDETQAAQRTRAALTVAGHSLDPGDCVELLSMLGLPDPDTRFAAGAWDRPEIQGYDLHGLADGRPVEFELGEGRQGPHATSVRVL